MRAWLRCTLAVISAGALVLALAACGSSKGSAGTSKVIAKTAHVTIRETAVVAVVAVVGPTLKLFWDLSSLQVRNPSVVPRLLGANPREVEDILRSVVGFEAYQEQLAKAAQVRPIVLFLRKGSDPVEEARKRNLAIAPWPEAAPPALLSGPGMDTLILFQPLTSASGESGTSGPDVLAQVASLRGLAGLSLAQTKPADRLDSKLYQVRPADWKKSATFEHTRCSSKTDELSLVTLLTYDGGATDVQPNALSSASWGPCALSPDKALKAVTVKQPGRGKAGRPVIIAASYFEDPHPSPLLSKWVAVK